MTFELDVKCNIPQGCHISLLRDYSKTSDVGSKNKWKQSTESYAALEKHCRGRPLLLFIIKFEQTKLHASCSPLHPASRLHCLSRGCSAKCFSTVKAVLGGATQCDGTERSRTTGHLHCERRAWRRVCVQSDSREHCTPGSFRVWRPAP